MSMRGSTRRIVLVAIAGGVLGLSTSADAQRARPEDGTLRGPRVRETRVPGQESRLTDGQMQGRPIADGMKRHAAFIQGLRMLGSGRAGEDLQLTEDQIVKLRKMKQDFRSSAKQFAQQRGLDQQDQSDKPRDRARGPQQRDGRRQMDDQPRRGQEVDRPRQRDQAQRPADQRRQRDNAQRPADQRRQRDNAQRPADQRRQRDNAQRPADRRPRDAGPSNMERPRQKTDGRPQDATRNRPQIATKIANHEKRMLLVLTQAQRQALRKYMVQMRKEETQRRMDEAVPERREQRERGDQQRDGKGRLIDRIPPRMRERLENLPPEERQRVIERLRERIESGEFGQRLERKPRPAMDEVDVPPPGDGDN